MTKYKTNNKGSGIVTVILAVTFVTVLGAILLLMTYMNYQMKTADSFTRRNFYSTEIAMDEARASLQNSVSKAIESAYTSTLILYGEASSNVGTDDKESQKQFANNFVMSLSPGLGITVTAADLAGGTPSKELLYTDTKLLETITKYVTIGTITVNADTAECKAVIRFNDDGLPVAIDIQGIAAEYTDNRGYKNTIYSDFTVNIPPFSAITAGFHSRLNNYIIVADDMLKASSPFGNSVNLHGNVYAGEVEISGNNYTLNIDGGYVISKGDYNIKDGASLNIGSVASVWANRINLHENAKANFGGNVYVADDLELKGPNAAVTINGSYFGFGLSDIPTQSSSIIVSGRNSVLDFQNLKTLILAGRSYITGADSDTAPNPIDSIPMANSLSVKSDQIAYLVPDSMLFSITNNAASKVPNPSVWAQGSPVPETYLFDPDAPDGVQYTNLSDGSIGGLPADTTYIRLTLTPEIKAYNAKIVRRFAQLPSTGDIVIYYFFTFDDDNDRSRFFADYYNQNKDKMNEYLGIYFIPAQADRINVTGALNTDGYIYEYINAATGYELRSTAYSQHITTIATTYKKKYESLIATLFESGIPQPSETPFTHFVDLAKINADFSGASAPIEFKNSAGKILAVIVPDNYPGNFNLNSGDSYKDVNIVIACGTDANVIVNRNFDGLILSQGKVTISESLIAGALTDGNTGGKTYEAFNAVNASAETLLLEYMIGASKGTAPTDDAADESAKNWNLNDLVVHKNWSKNEQANH